MEVLRPKVSYAEKYFTNIAQRGNVITCFINEISSVLNSTLETVKIFICIVQYIHNSFQEFGPAQSLLKCSTYL